MSELVMIPIGQLRHHPQNPRSDLGDLTELTESIKAQGILQNLTVIPDPTYDPDPGMPKDRYWVVIGNRRFEASKAAGLTELPCKIAQMDEKEAMETMMAENMQRQDLTLLDQIQGVGYMQQLGMSIPDIAKGTGLSEKTVRSRAKVAKLPKKELTLACEKGVTLMDLLDVMDLQSEAKRQEVLREAGGNNFRWALNSAKADQASKAWKAQVMPSILAKYPRIGEVPSSETYSGKWQTVWRCSNRDEKTPTVPDPKPGKKYAMRVMDFLIELYEESEKWKAQKADEKIYDAWMKDRKATAKALNREAWELRAQFIRKFRLKSGAEAAKFNDLLLNHTMTWFALQHGIGYYHSAWNSMSIRQILAIPYEQDRDKEETFEHELARRGIKREAYLLAWAVSGGICNECRDGYISEYSATWKECGELDETYDLLIRLGYEMSDFEISLRDKTHEFFKEADRP